MQRIVSFLLSAHMLKLELKSVRQEYLVSLYKIRITIYIKMQINKHLQAQYDELSIHLMLLTELRATNKMVNAKRTHIYTIKTLKCEIMTGVVIKILSREISAT